jgi:hypothetical protein
LLSLFVIALALAPPILLLLDNRFNLGLDLANAEYLPKLTQENTTTFVNYVLNIANTSLQMLLSVILCKNMADNKHLAALGLFTFFVGLKFNTITLLFVFANVLFTVPIIYKRYKVIIDEVVLHAYTKVEDVFTRGEQSIKKKQ